MELLQFMLQGSVNALLYNNVTMCCCCFCCFKIQSCADCVHAPKFALKFLQQCALSDQPNADSAVSERSWRCFDLRLGKEVRMKLRERERRGSEGVKKLKNSCWKDVLMQLQWRWCTWFNDHLLKQLIKCLVPLRSVLSVTEGGIKQRHLLLLLWESMRSSPFMARAAAFLEPGFEGTMALYENLQRNPKQAFFLWAFPFPVN